MSTERATGVIVAGGALGLSGQALQEMLCAVLDQGVPFRFQARGHSMHPFLQDRDLVTVAPLPERPLRAGEIVAFRHPQSGALVLHRIREIRTDGLLVQGDNLASPDVVIGDDELIGLVVRAERGGQEVHRGEEPPDAVDRVAWRARLWWSRLFRHLTSLRRSVGAAQASGVGAPAQPGYALQRSLWELGPLQQRNDRQVLRELELELTARCNCDCRHCAVALPASDPTAKVKELTLVEIDRIAGEAADLGVLWVLLTGGEPLLREDFAEVYLVLKRRGLLVSVFTNATLVDRSHVELFRRYPPRDLEVTLYGATETTYERVTRRPGSYRAFRRGLDLLIEGGVKVRLKAMVIRSNVHELPEIARFGRAHTKDFFRFDPLLTLRHDGDSTRNQTIRDERLSPAEIVEIEQADEERSRALHQACDRLIGESCGSAACDHLFHCGVGRSSCFVAADGTFRLCASLVRPDTTFDLRHGSLRQAWETVVPRVRELRSQRPAFFDGCRRCELVNLCQWCPAHAHLELGELDARPDGFCAVAYERARAIRSKLR